MPRNITPTSAPMIASVVRAWRASGRLEGRDAVRDGLDPGDRAAAVGEGTHQQEEAERLDRDDDRRRRR